MSIHGDHGQTPSRPEPILTREQQEELGRAASEALANLALVMPPILAQFQQLAAVTLPAIRKAVEPMLKYMQELDLKPGDPERLAGEEAARERGEALARVMSDGLYCYQCEPPRYIVPGMIEQHLKIVHDGGKHKVPHPRKELCLRDEMAKGGATVSYCSCAKCKKATEEA